MLGPHACFGWVSDPRSLVYGETLARGPRAVYPLRFLRRTASRGASVLLSHVYMHIVAEGKN
jgi:hypothetical protein